jgi:putative transposase
MRSPATKLLYHIVFSTKHRIVCIDETGRARLHQCLGGTIRGLGGIPHAVGGVGHYVYLLVAQLGHFNRRKRDIGKRG